MNTEINLRDARKIANRIKQHEHLPSNSCYVHLSRFREDNPDKIEEAISKGKINFSDTVQKYLTLNRIKYNLRLLVDKANQTSGVSNLLNEKARAENELNVYSQYRVDVPVELNSNVLDKRLKALETSEYGDASISVTVVDYETFNKNYIDKKREIRRLESELEELNITTKITVPEEDMKELESSGII